VLQIDSLLFLFHDVIADIIDGAKLSHLLVFLLLFHLPRARLCLFLDRIPKAAFDFFLLRLAELLLFLLEDFLDCDLLPFALSGVEYFLVGVDILLTAVCEEPFISHVPCGRGRQVLPTELLLLLQSYFGMLFPFVHVEHESQLSLLFIFFPHTDVLMEGSTQKLPHLLQFFYCEVMSHPLLIKVTQKRSLQGKAVHNIEFSPDDNSGRLFFRLLHLEFAPIEPEHSSLF